MLVEEGGGGGLVTMVDPATMGRRNVVVEAEGLGECSGVNLVCENLALANGLDTKGATVLTADCLTLLLGYDAFSSSRRPTNESRCTALFASAGFPNRLARTSSLGYRTSSGT